MEQKTWLDKWERVMDNIQRVLWVLVLLMWLITEYKFK